MGRANNRITHPKGLNDQVGDDYRKDKTAFAGLTIPYLTKTNSKIIMYIISGNKFLFKSKLKSYQ